MATSQCKRRPVFCVVDVIQGLPFSSASLDTVVCVGILETLPDPISLMAEVMRVLKPSGTLVLSHYRGGGRWYRELVDDFSHTELIPFHATHDLLVAQRDGMKEPTIQPMKSHAALPEGYRERAAYLED